MFSKSKTINKNWSEKIYNIRRFVEIDSAKRNSPFKLWKIHGDVHSPKSIMLGLDHYCGSIGKIDSYIKGQYALNNNVKVSSMEDKLKSYSDDKGSNNKLDFLSWVELMFFSNIHIVGFGMDFSETDLWWVLNKRARLSKEFKVPNKIYYYVGEMVPSKKLLLESIKVLYLLMF